MGETEQFNAATPAEGLAGAPPVDELAARRLDHEGDEKAINEMLVPDGRYSTKSATVREFVAKGRDGTDARIMFNVDAQLINAKDIKREDGTIVPAGTYEDEIEFMFSHQRRDRQEGERAGEPDRAFQNYLKLKATHKAVMQADAGTVDDLKSFIESYPLSLRITRFQGRNWVVDIGAVKV